MYHLMRGYARIWSTYALILPIPLRCEGCTDKSEPFNFKFARALLKETSLYTMWFAKPTCVETTIDFASQAHFASEVGAM